MKKERKANGLSTEISTQTKSEYKCNICNDLEFIINGNEAIPCKCRALREHERRMNKSGIGDEFKSRTFGNYATETSNQAILKDSCMEYVKSKGWTTGGVCILGNVGSGKTHLAMAIANNLLAKGIEVVYVDYRSFISRMKQSLIDKDTYQSEIARLTEAEILYIDDLYKGKITEVDSSVMFEIINSRYLAKKPIIITSEMCIEQILDVDEGVGSRIYEMCKGYMLVSDGENMRLKH